MFVFVVLFFCREGCCNTEVCSRAHVSLCQLTQVP